MQDLGIGLIGDIAAAYMDKPNRLHHLIVFQTKFETLKTLMRIAGERQWIKGMGRHAHIIELMDAIGKQSTAWKNSMTAKKGVEFTGAIVKPYRKYCCNRVLTNFIAAVRKLNRARNIDEVNHAVCSINSYLGLLRQSNEHGKRREILGMIAQRIYKWIYIKGHYEVVAIKNKYKQNCITQKRIRDGDY